MSVCVEQRAVGHRDDVGVQPAARECEPADQHDAAQIGPLDRHRRAAGREHGLCHQRMEVIAADFESLRVQADAAFHRPAFGRPAPGEAIGQGLNLVPVDGFGRQAEIERDVLGREPDFPARHHPVGPRARLQIFHAQDGAAGRRRCGLFRLELSEPDPDGFLQKSGGDDHVVQPGVGVKIPVQRVADPAGEAEAGDFDVALDA